MNVTVVGAGIMGLGAAWALARHGHRVAVYEQYALPNPLGGSVDDHRLIRYPYGAARGYARMVTDAYAAWAQVWADLGETLYAPTGTLVLETSDGAWVEDSAAAMAALGIPFVRLTPGETARRFPLLATEGVRGALQFESGGVLFAGRIVAALAKRLSANGIAVHPHAKVRELHPGRGEIVLDGGGRIGADMLVVAAGPWAPRLVPGLAARVTPSRQVVVYLAPPPDCARGWEAHPMVLDIDPRAGFYLVPPRAGTGLKVGDHGFTLRGDPDRDREPAAAEADAILSLCAPRLRDFARYRPLHAKTCFYDVAPAERFVVEPIGPACWVMTGFSGHGFKFGPLIGLEFARTLEGRRSAAAFSAWAAGAGERDAS